MRTRLITWRLSLLIALSATMPWVHAAAQSAGDGEKLQLNSAERAWVNAHPTIKVGADPLWPPFSVAALNETYSGIDPDLLALIGQRIGIKFEFVHRSTWPEVFESATRREIDLLAGTARTVEREKAFLFTEPYFSFPVVIVTRNDEPILWSVLDLTGRRVVGVSGYVATSELAREYPGLKFLPPTTTVRRAMEMVSAGEADAFITNLPNASFTAKTRGLTNLKIAGVMPERFNLCYAVRPDWPELTALLNRGIASITEADRQNIVHAWIRVDYDNVIRWDVVWRTALLVLGVVGVVLAAGVYHNRRLSRELRERIQLQHQIKDAHDRMVQLNEDKTELLQMAAHDLRGPLTGIQLAIDASTRMKVLPPDEAMGIVAKQVRQMTGLLNNLLDAEALEQGRREFQMARLTPQLVLRGSVTAQTATAATKSIRLETSVLEPVPEIEADATAFRQITDNLISNAIKFSPFDSVVEVVLRRVGGFVQLEVLDRGPGVAPEETERIFGKYARGSARPTGGEKSTGLGLSIVRRLAEAMNGRVWCEPRPGGGSAFICEIPVAPARAASLTTVTRSEVGE